MNKDYRKINKPLVSVLMSVYNSESTVSKAIESVLHQTYTNFEFLIIDDGSTDNTYETISSYRSDKIKIFKNNENIGLTKSLNYLSKKCNGQLIARQDADDLSMPEKLNVQVKCLLSNNLAAVGSRAKILNTNKLIPSLSYYLPIRFQTLFKNPLIHGTLLINKSVFLNLGGYNEEYLFAQDYKLLVDLLKNKYKIKILKDTLYELNVNNNISSIYKVEQKEYFKRARKDYLTKF